MARFGEKFANKQRERYKGPFEATISRPFTLLYKKHHLLISPRSYNFIDSLPVYEPIKLIKYNIDLLSRTSDTFYRQATQHIFIKLPSINTSTMPSHQYQVTEPHPSVTTSSFIHSGRGGAGNTFKAPPTTNGRDARGPASLFSRGLPETSIKFSSGRGGAGNILPTSKKAPFSFDEELDRQSTRDKKMNAGGIWHVGRGGAGNWAAGRPSSERKNSESSVDSSGSERSGGFWGRLM
ncbi:hypothetical protein ACMFMG_008113 [Clarireedia jacksonii]